MDSKRLKTFFDNYKFNVIKILKSTYMKINPKKEK